MEKQKTEKQKQKTEKQKPKPIRDCNECRHFFHEYDTNYSSCSPLESGDISDEDMDKIDNGKIECP